MKLKKSKLRKIINEELVRVIMESDVKRFVALKENLDGETDPEGKMAKSQLEISRKCTDARFLNDRRPTT